LVIFILHAHKKDMSISSLSLSLSFLSCSSPQEWPGALVVREVVSIVVLMANIAASEM
jgi:hypothetical protein